MQKVEIRQNDKHFSALKRMCAPYDLLDPAVHGRGRLRLGCMFQRYAKQKLECSVQSCAEDQNFQIVRCPLFDDLPYPDFWRVPRNRLL